MKFEFVEFYPGKNKNKKVKGREYVGTVHIYVVDANLDIRGIRVNKAHKGLFFNFPHFVGHDPETGEETRYPHFRWTSEATQKEMIKWLQTEVAPLILARINASNAPRFASTPSKTVCSRLLPSSIF